jgi:superfamily II DNA helicase RecQ
MKRLDRIVIDECHIVLNQQRDFRPMMQQLGRLMMARTQVVLLTATLPPSLEGRLWQRMRWSREQVSLFRGRTSRTNVAYRLWRPIIEREYEGPHRWIQMDHIAAFIRDRIRRSQGGRTIVYAHIVEHVTMMAKILGCEAYYHDQVDKTGVLERFRREPKGVVVATSALGMGVDIPDIRSIIHLGRPRTLLDYAQESGRAGRDGQASEAIIIQPNGIDTPPPWMQDTPSAEQQRVDAYMSASPCRRVVLDGYLDGVVDGYQRSHCGDHDHGSITGEARCDVCDPDWEVMEEQLSSEAASEALSPGASPGASQAASQAASQEAREEAREDAREDASDRASSVDSESLQSQAPWESPIHNQTPTTGASAGSNDHGGIPFGVRQQFRQQDIDRARMSEQHQQARQQELTDEEFLMQQAREWQDRCWICAQEGQDAEHELYHCTRPSSQRARDWMIRVRRRVQYARYTSCFQCGMPQTLCSGWSGGECAHRGLLYAMVGMMLFGGPEQEQVQRLWEQRLAQQGVSTQDEQQVTGFLGQRSTQGWEKHTELVRAFIWLRRIYSSIGM